MYKLIGKSNERILCKLNKSEILRLYSIVHVAMETTKTSNFTCQSKSFISVFFACQISAGELQPFSCHDLANEIHSQTAKTVFSHQYTMSIYFEFKIYIYQLRFSLFQIFSSNLSQLNVYIIYHHINSQLDHNYFNSFSILLSITNLTCYILDSI